jgi:hypothetical protein
MGLPCHKRPKLNEFQASMHNLISDILSKSHSVRHSINMCSKISLDQEKYRFNLFSKQHGPFEVNLVKKAMESFRQKVTPISLGAFEDIFD